MHRKFLSRISVYVLAAPLACTVPCAFSQALPAAPSAVKDAVPDASLSLLQDQAATAPQITAATQAAGSISGTVTDANGDLIGQASVVLAGPDSRVEAASNADGMFAFSGVKPGGPYRVTVSANGFDEWASEPVTIAPGEFAIVKGIQLKLSSAVASVTVTASTVQIATEQVALEEKQRIFGIIPNFYVVYDSQNAVPMTAKLKFQMAWKVSIDPVSFLGAAVLAGIDQASDTPDYPQGAKGYGERFGSVYADGFTDTMFGGAILPVILHQDPRYYYKGTGSIGSRALHAIGAPFVCKGDNGKWQPNFSSVGGDVISAGISNSYYPKGDRGAGLLFENVAIETAERAVSTLIQEFVLRRWTPSAKDKN